jgi:glycosyltransferase involved in cell wall biosynthesis
MGLGHRFGEFLSAAEKLGSSGLRWVFAGGGKRRAEVEAFARAHPQARIEMLPYVPREQLREHLCAADVHLASLDSAWQGLIVPSKVQASFCVGRPVIFVGGRENETAQWIAESDGGWVVPEDDVAGLLEAVTQARDPAERRRRGGAARAFAERHFQMRANCTQIAEWVEACVR